jgi:hypothetical protein
VIEDVPKRRDLNDQVIILDYRPRPDGNHDLVLRDQIPLPLDQHAEHVERARADRHRHENTTFTPPEQAAPVETETPEQENVGRGECVHASASRAFLNLVTI